MGGHVVKLGIIELKKVCELKTGDVFRIDVIDDEIHTVEEIIDYYSHTETRVETENGTTIDFLRDEEVEVFINDKKGW